MDIFQVSQSGAGSQTAAFEGGNEFAEASLSQGGLGSKLLWESQRDVLWS